MMDYSSSKQQFNQFSYAREMNGKLWLPRALGKTPERHFMFSCIKQVVVESHN